MYFKTKTRAKSTLYSFKCMYTLSIPQALSFIQYSRNQGKLIYVKYAFNKGFYHFSHVYSAMQLFCNNKANLITRPQSSGALGHLLKCKDLTINWIDPKDARKSLCVDYQLWVISNDYDEAAVIVYFTAYFHYAVHYGVYQKAE